MEEDPDQLKCLSCENLVFKNFAFYDICEKCASPIGYCYICKRVIKHNRILCKLCKITMPDKIYTRLSRAIKRNIKWALTNEYALNLLKSYCFYCGDTGGSIDRIDSNGNYTEDNVVPACLRCNMMKQSLSIEDWLNHIKKILNHSQSKD